MDFTYTSEQDLLRDSAERFATKGYGFDKYKASLEVPGQCDTAVWGQFAEFGWLALGVPEAAGGIGGSTLDLALIGEALGAGMVIEPFVTGLVLPAAALARDAKQADLLGQAASGDAQLALAYAERAGRFDPAFCETRAEASGKDFKLSGSKHCVFNAPNATHLVVSARVSGVAGDAKGIELFVVPRETAGVKLVAYPVLGGGSAADVTLEGVVVDASAKVDGGFEALDAALDRATAVACAQALGGMRALLERTVAYLRQRKQFGVPIGTFQVLQHRVVDMQVEVEQTRSMVLMAAVKADSPSAQERRRAVSAAKAYVGKASKFVAQQAVQLHGGIGVTEELDVGHYFRQLTAFGTKFGDRDYHLGRFAASE
ncbi:MAG TPA: acyl-CoA dehydrogenase family protein [Nevskiaceae bacterium]|nr:acyl-CoA dehydrogenase family protein [Nevskiaceae bacterium]